MATSTVPMPSSSARNLLAVAGVSVLWATLGCQLGESDVVIRSPDVGYGIGGTGGQDAPGVEAATLDTAPLSSLRLDGSGVMDRAPEDVGTGAEVRSSSDGVDVTGYAGPDAVNALGDAISAGEVPDTCSSEGYQFCEDFEDGASMWASTGVNWAVTEESGALGSTAVFGPTSPAASTAFVPSGAWQDMTVEARVMVTSFGQASSLNRAIVYARYQDPAHFYAVSLCGDGKLVLRRNAAAFGTVASVSVGENEWHALKIRVSGSVDDVLVEGYLDGALLTVATDTSGSLTSDIGTVGVGVYGGTLAVFDDVRVSSP